MTHQMKVKRKVEVTTIDSGPRLTLGAARAAINRAAREARNADLADGTHRLERWEVKVEQSGSSLIFGQDTLKVVAERSL